MTERWIDIVLQNNEVIRRLRFIRPVNLSVEEGFPECPGLYIEDVSKDRLEDSSRFVSGILRQAVVVFLFGLLR